MHGGETQNYSETRHTGEAGERDALAAVDDMVAEAGGDEDTLRGNLVGARARVYWRASVLVSADRFDEALAELESAYEKETDEAARAIWADGIALALTFKGEAPERARELVVWAYERLPWIPYIAALRALLASTAPVAALAAAERHDPQGQFRNMTRGFLAIVQARFGDVAAALRTAKSLRDPFPGIERLLEAELRRQGENTR